MKVFLFIFLGGGIGSCLRYLISLLWQHLRFYPAFAATVFPWPTLIANILGCFLIGIFYQYSEKWELSTEVRLLLTTGLCGGFTTFSTFSYEGLGLLRSGNYTIYFIYIATSLIFGLIAAFIPSLFIHNT